MKTQANIETVGKILGKHVHPLHDYNLDHQVVRAAVYCAMHEYAELYASQLFNEGQVREALDNTSVVMNPIGMDGFPNKKSTYCFQCGTTVKNQRFCHNCGRKLIWKSK